MSVAYGVCVSSWEKFAANVAPHTTGRLVYAAYGQTSIAEAYEEILRTVESRPEVDALILQHDDLEIVDPDGESKLLAALAQPDVALAGVAGGGIGGGLAWWTDNPVGRVPYDGGVVDFGSRSGDVRLLDGCLLALPAETIRRLRVSRRPGFHGYDGDISMRAGARGRRRVVVVDVDVRHHTALGFDDLASEADWIDADRQFRERWAI